MTPKSVKLHDGIACDEPHTKIWRSKRLDEAELLVSNCERAVKIWNTHEKISKELHDHTDWVTCLIRLSDARIASGSDDSAIKIWNISTDVCELTLVGHTDSVNALLLINSATDEQLLSGSEDKTIKAWNIHTGLCLRTIILQSRQS